MQIRDMRDDDWPSVRAIYEAGIATGHATFQTEAPGWEAWDSGHLATCRLIAADEHGGVVGWAALSPVSGRPVYSGVVEVSVYVDPRRSRRGIGRRLLSALIDAAEADGRWTMQASIFPENAASIGLHIGCGFREVGRRERIGRMGDVWRDTLLLERRSGRIA